MLEINKSGAAICLTGRRVILVAFAVWLLSLLSGCAYKNRASINYIEEINGFAYIATSNKNVNKYDIVNDKYTKVKIVNGYNVSQIFHNGQYIIYSAYKQGKHGWQYINSLLIYDNNDHLIKIVENVPGRNVTGVAIDDKYIYFAELVSKTQPQQEYYKKYKFSIAENLMSEGHFDDRTDIIISSVVEDDGNYWYACVSENSGSKFSPLRGQIVLARKDKISQQIDFTELQEQAEIKGARIQVDDSQIWITSGTVIRISKADLAIDKHIPDLNRKSSERPDEASRFLWFASNPFQSTDNTIYRLNKDLFRQLPERCEPCCREQAKTNPGLIVKAEPSPSWPSWPTPGFSPALSFQDHPQQSSKPITRQLSEEELKKNLEKYRKEKLERCMASCNTFAPSMLLNYSLLKDGALSKSDSDTCADAGLEVIKNSVSSTKIASGKEFRFGRKIITHGNYAVVGGYRFGIWSPATGDKTIPYVARLASDSDEVKISPVKTTLVEGVTNLAISFANDAAFAVWYPSILLLSWITGNEPF